MTKTLKMSIRILLLEIFRQFNSRLAFSFYYTTYIVKKIIFLWIKSWKCFFEHLFLNYNKAYFVKYFFYSKNGSLVSFVSSFHINITFTQ